MQHKGIVIALPHAYSEAPCFLFGWGGLYTLSRKWENLQVITCHSKAVMPSGKSSLPYSSNLFNLQLGGTTPARSNLLPLPKEM